MRKNVELTLTFDKGVSGGTLQKSWSCATEQFRLTCGGAKEGCGVADDGGHGDDDGQECGEELVEMEGGDVASAVG